MVVEEAHLEVPCIDQRDAIVNLLLAAVLDHQVSELERLAEALHDLEHFLLVALADRVRLGEHADRTDALRVNFVGTLEDVDGGDVDVRRDDAKDDRALLLQVAVEKVVDVFHHVARLASDLGAHNSRKVDDGQVRHVGGDQVDNDRVLRLEGSMRATRQQQRLSELGDPLADLFVAVHLAGRAWLRL